jgi:hypothetical protein
MKKKIITRFVPILIILAACISLGLFRNAIFSFRKRPEAVPSKYKVEVVKAFPFSEENALKEWEEKIFKNKVVYRIEKASDLAFVRAKAEDAASALYYQIKMDAKNKRPVVSWKWHVEKFPAKKLPENLEKQDEDDFAARVYVIFPAFFFTNSKVLEYIWAEKLPMGTIGTSPYSENIKIFVLKSGAANPGEWFTENRDIIEDYRKAFGINPDYDIGALAFMTNTEHTGSSADAVYDEINLGYKEDAKEGQ